MLRTNETFQGKLKELLDLAKSPFIQGIISAFGIDTKMIDDIFQALLYDEVSICDNDEYVTRGDNFRN